MTTTGQTYDIVKMVFSSCEFQGKNTQNPWKQPPREECVNGEGATTVTTPKKLFSSRGASI